MAKYDMSEIMTRAWEIAKKIDTYYNCKNDKICYNLSTSIKLAYKEKNKNTDILFPEIYVCSEDLFNAWLKENSDMQRFSYALNYGVFKFVDENRHEIIKNIINKTKKTEKNIYLTNNLNSGELWEECPNCGNEPIFLSNGGYCANCKEV